VVTDITEDAKVLKHNKHFHFIQTFLCKLLIIIIVIVKVVYHGHGHFTQKVYKTKISSFSRFVPKKKTALKRSFY